jgi:hypothetical protein
VFGNRQLTEARIASLESAVAVMRSEIAPLRRDFGMLRALVDAMQAQFVETMTLKEREFARRVNEFLELLRAQERERFAKAGRARAAGARLAANGTFTQNV